MLPGAPGGVASSLQPPPAALVGVHLLWTTMELPPLPAWRLSHNKTMQGCAAGGGACWGPREREQLPASMGMVLGCLLAQLLWTAALLTACCRGWIT
jgi:hypothetical protein